MASSRSAVGLLSDAPRRRFTVEEVYRMLEAGVLSEDEPIELLAGELVVVSRQGPRHAQLIGRLGRLLEEAAGPGAHARIQMPLDAGPDSLPEPDVCVAKGGVDDYRDRHPAGQDVLLAVEVAVTALAEARRKVPIYAAARVPLLWILDELRRRLEVYARPQGDRYDERRLLEPEERVGLPGGGSVTVADLLR